MTLRSLNEAIFRLGQISGERNHFNAVLLRELADVTLETLGVDAVTLCVFEQGVEGPPTQRIVRGPWAEKERDRFLEQSGWEFDERALARRLAGMRRGRLYHRPDLISDREYLNDHGEQASPVPLTPRDQAVALYRRCDGVELLLSIHRVDLDSPLHRTTLARAGTLAPYVAQCWASCWKHEPDWMKRLKPISRTILDTLLEGLDDDQIAARTGLSYHSVRAHLKRLFRDAGVRSRLHLMQACRGCTPPANLIIDLPIDEPARQATG